MRGRRRLDGVVDVAALALVLAAGALTGACRPKAGALGDECRLGCTNATLTSFCQSVDDVCNSDLASPCVGVVASGGTCSRSCVRDDDCRGATVPMVCSGACLRDESICLAVQDAQRFCRRTSPPISCVDLQLSGDGICDGPSGTGHCADDADDCGAQEPWAATCAVDCQKLRGTACPLDDLVACETSCMEAVAGNPACRSQVKAVFACRARDDAHACGADQRSHDTGVCDAESSAWTACQQAFVLPGT